ncbi:hypothetical protein KF134_2289 [Lactococcus lactis subsp. lactis]|nr:hypothetical protein KF134_2289 [Lactococcus lactis subsp. lactis]
MLLKVGNTVTDIGAAFLRVVKPFVGVCYRVTVKTPTR